MSVLYIRICKDGDSKSSFVKWLKKIFCIIDIQELYNGYISILPCHMNECKKNEQDGQETSKHKLKLSCYKKIYYKLLSWKIKRIIKDKCIETLVISDEIQHNNEFMQILSSLYNGKNKQKANDIKLIERVHILDGNILFRCMIYDIFLYITNIQNKSMELTDLYLLVNNLNDDISSNIIFLSKYFRTINIVTKNLKSFNKMEKIIYEKTGTYITVTNNKRKSLKKAEYIVNIDFEPKELEKYSLYRKSIIINATNNINTKISLFDGIQIKSFDVDLSDKLNEFFETYKLKNEVKSSILFESILNTKDDFLNVRNQIEESEIKISKLYGSNGIIDINEYKRIAVTQPKTYDINYQNKHTG